MAFENPPFRLRVLRGITDLIKTVTIDNGFSFDLTDDEVHDRPRVVRGRPVLGNDSDPDALVSIIEASRPIEQIVSPEDAEVRAGEWDILIQGWVRNDLLPGYEDCDLTYYLANDVQNVLMREKKRGAQTDSKNRDYFGENAVYSFRVGAPVVRPTEEVSGYGVFYLILTLNIAEDTAD
jgi:hypothetical protein